jgi:predicted kinase
MPQKPLLYIFVGYPGAGKTTVAQTICRLTDAEHIWADKERRQMFGKRYNSDQSAELYHRLNDMTARWLQSGRSVVFDTNFNYKKDRQHLARIASQHGAQAKLIWLTTSVELSKQRAVGSRQFIDMTAAEFDTTVAKLEPPTDNENPIKIDGSDISETTIKKQICGL